ncbi:MAG: alkaline phosphatase family protein [Vicingaceae bacterium]
MFAQTERPKLVVGIVVDQMRQDYLYRFWDKFGDNGFKKIATYGYMCKNTHYNYIPTFTGPGHATIYTGTTPKFHGIIANTWYDKTNKNYLYCTQDPSVNTVGSEPSTYGQMSPKNLLSTTITDELKIFTQKKSKVIAVSIKDRGAILPGGHMADAAYWFEGGNSGKFITSSFYLNELPEWVNKFNAKNLPGEYLSKPWATLLPIKDYTESYKDDSPYEGKYVGESKPIFPHNLPKLKEANGNYSLIKATPFGNTLVTEFAINAILNENLGKNSSTDFLCISYSSTDYVGHQFGPNSIELEDTYLRLDKDLEKLVGFLEKNVGKENFILFLTADHGAAFNPQFLIDNKVPAGYFNYTPIKKLLKEYALSLCNDTSLIASLSNDQVFINEQLVKEKNLNLHQIEKDIQSLITPLNGIQAVYTKHQLIQHPGNDLIANGINPQRSGNVIFILQPGWIDGYSLTGTTHGSGYNYDTHVPLIWYGKNIPMGYTSQPVAITDIVYNLALMLNIPFPNTTFGKPIYGLIK